MSLIDVRVDGCLPLTSSVTRMPAGKPDHSHDCGFIRFGRRTVYMTINGFVRVDFVVSKVTGLLFCYVTLSCDVLYYDVLSVPFVYIIIVSVVSIAYM